MTSATGACTPLTFSPPFSATACSSCVSTLTCSPDAVFNARLPSEIAKGCGTHAQDLQLEMHAVSSEGSCIGRGGGKARSSSRGTKGGAKDRGLCVIGQAETTGADWAEGRCMHGSVDTGGAADDTYHCSDGEKQKDPCVQKQKNSDDPCVTSCKRRLLLPLPPSTSQTSRSLPVLLSRPSSSMLPVSALTTLCAPAAAHETATLAFAPARALAEPTNGKRNADTLSNKKDMDRERDMILMSDLKQTPNTSCGEFKREGSWGTGGEDEDRVQLEDSKQSTGCLSDTGTTDEEVDISTRRQRRRSRQTSTRSSRHLTSSSSSSCERPLNPNTGRGEGKGDHIF